MKDKIIDLSVLSVIVLLSFSAGYFNGIDEGLRQANRLSTPPIGLVYVSNYRQVFEFSSASDFERLKPSRTNAPAVAYGPNKMIAGWMVRKQSWKMLK